MSEPALSTANFSPRSHAMLALRDAVIADWERAVRATNREASTLDRPVLINTLPLMYERLCRLLTPALLDVDASEVSSVAAEHGSERARMSGYQVHALVVEYQLFRRVLFDAIERAGIVPDAQQAGAMHRAIDVAVQQSVHAFSHVQSSLRERFAAALTHDLRQPLANIGAAAQLIRAAPGTDRDAQLAAQICRNAERMAAMLEELLDALVIPAGERLHLTLERFDLWDLVREVAARAVQFQGLEIVLQGGPAPGCWSRAALERSLENLLGNAAKHGDRLAPITVRLSASSERVVLSVHNSGKPIPRAQFDLIFQDFVRADETRRGWGIGLSYVRRAAESHGGSVVVFSEEGSGTTFVIDLPLDAQPFQASPVR